MMKSFNISCLALLITATPIAAQAGESPAPRGGLGHVRGTMGGMHRPRLGGVHMPRPGGHHVGGHHAGGPRNWGPRQNGRWMGGHRAPGGWGSYRRPFAGYVLPSYWVNPGFYIGNYSSYGFSRPTTGYGWSRYYDDAVLTDRYGRVYDSVYDVDWDRYDRYDEGYGRGDDYADSYGYRDDGYANDGRGRDRDRGLGGAIAGGAIGAVAGSIIGGRGDRTAGALIGGGVGALAGAAIDSGDRYGRGDRAYGYDDRSYRPRKIKRSKQRRGDMPYDYGYDGRGNDGVTYNGQWNGTWTGSWNGGPTQTYEGRYEGDGAHWQGGAGSTYPAPTAGGDQGPVIVHRGAGPVNYNYGYGGGEVTTITIQPQPVTTTTTTVTEEVYYTSVARRRAAPRKVWRPKPRPRCVCKVVYR